jgi:predicted transcriptional regulator
MYMRLNRSRIDLFNQILEATNGAGGGSNGGLSQTKIMYRANLGHTQLKEYLTVLIENDLLSYDSASRKFKTTEKGLRLLDTYNQMSDVMKTEQQQQLW